MRKGIRIHKVDRVKGLEGRIMPEPETHEDVARSYDDRQIEAPLVTYRDCGRRFYMTVVRERCVECAEKQCEPKP